MFRAFDPIQFDRSRLADRALFGQGTPKEGLWRPGVLIVVQTDLCAACIVVAVILAVIDDQPTILLIASPDNRSAQ